jgi:hypothetical protein
VQHLPGRQSQTKLYQPKIREGETQIDVESLGGYLIANETVSSKGKMRSRLWYWQGSAHEPVQVKLEGLKKLKNIEGLTSYRHDKQESILVVCDDGSRKKGTGAHFAIFPLADIKKAIRR